MSASAAPSPTGERKHRSDTLVFLVGHPILLEACSSLPARCAVLKDFLARREGVTFDGSARNLDITKETLSAVKQFWDIGNIPRLTEYRCEYKVIELWKEWQTTV